MHKLLIIDDNQKSLMSKQNYLVLKDYDVYLANNGETALDQLSVIEFDCIVLNALLPDIDGFSLCGIIREKTDTSIILLLSNAAQENKINGILAGADDYLTEPYSLEELNIRIFAQIRRTMMNKRLFVFDENKYNIVIDGNIIDFSKKEFELLMLFYKNPNKLFSPKEIYTILWEKDVVSNNSVAVYVKRLRNKLNNVSGQFGQIKNSYKVGYYFSPPKGDA